MFAVMSVDAVAVPLNPRAGARELRLILRDLQPAFLITVQRVNLTKIREEICAARGSVVSTPVVLLVDERACVGVDGGQKLSRANRPEMNGSRSGDENDLATIFYTTGTTGEPKGVMHTHAGLLGSIKSMQDLQEAFFSAPVTTAVARFATLMWRYRRRLRNGIGRQVWMSPLPLYSMAGFRFTTQALLGGHSLVLVEGFHPDGILDLVARERVNVLALTPSMLQITLNVVGSRSRDLSSLLVIGLGGAPVSPGIVRRARASFGCAVVIGYGSTETAGGLLATRMEDRERDLAETVGKAFPGVEVRIVDEFHHDVQAGTMGEVACRVPGIMAGYHDPASQTANVVDNEGWYYTGDLGTMDHRGYVRIVGRRRDLIIRGGYNIVPAEVETVLCDHSSVEEAAVVGIYHESLGEAIWAFIVPSPGCGFSMKELRTYCLRELTPEKRPNHYRIVAELPRAESGEVQRSMLRHLVQVGTSDDSM